MEVAVGEEVEGAVGPTGEGGGPTEEEAGGVTVGAVEEDEALGGDVEETEVRECLALD